MNKDTRILKFGQQSHAMQFTWWRQFPLSPFLDIADVMSLEGDNEPRISFLFVTQTFIAIKRNQASIGSFTYKYVLYPFPSTGLYWDFDPSQKWKKMHQQN